MRTLNLDSRYWLGASFQPQFRMSVVLAIAERICLEHTHMDTTGNILQCKRTSVLKCYKVNLGSDKSIFGPLGRVQEEILRASDKCRCPFQSLSDVLYAMHAYGTRTLSSAFVAQQPGALSRSWSH